MFNMSKKVSKLEPQAILERPFVMGEYRAFLDKVKQNNWIIADYPNGDNPTAIYALLQGQTIENGEIVIDTKQLDLEKEMQIEANNRLCKAEIEAIASVSDQLNMLLAQASKTEGADEKLKDFETKKNEILAYNKQLKAKINNSTSIKEIRKCVFNIEEIKEIKGIDTIK